MVPSSAARTRLLPLVAAALLAGTACAGSRPPNLLLITLDTTRADHLGCYGYPRNTSPVLNRLAAEGVRFDNLMAQASVTPVSHASILTGLQPFHHGLRALHGYRDLMLSDSAPTLAEILGERGYETGAVISAFPASSRYGLDRGFGWFEEGFLGDRPEQWIDADGIVNTGGSQRRADETTWLAIEWLEENAGVPFFLWVHYFDPHDAHLIPTAAFLDFCGVTPGGTPEQLISLYDCEIHFVDTEIGHLLQRLRSLGLERRTVVAVTADHGEGLGDHHWWTHGILYREQIRVPLILRGPGLPSRRVVQVLAQSVDIVPTLLEILGIDPGGIRFDGVSRMADVHGSPADDPPTAYSESRNLASYGVPHTPGARDRKDDELYGLIRGRWKYIHHRLRPEESELFDLQADPGESDNRFASQPGVVREFIRILEGNEEIFAAGRLTPPTPEARERLRSLGYLEPDPPGP